MRQRLLPFLLVGAGGFMLQVTVVLLLTRALHWPAAAAAGVGVEAAVLLNFSWHERWTWADRRIGGPDRARRLRRFHWTNGVGSLVGNALVAWLLSGQFGVDPVVSTVVAVAVMSAWNFWAADWWAFPPRGGPSGTPVVSSRCVVSALGLLLLAATSSEGAGPAPDTLAAWNQHLLAVEAGPLVPAPAALEAPEGRMVDVPGGTIHEWRGSVLLPHITVPQVLDALLANRVRQAPDVVESQVLSRRGDAVRLRLKLVRRVIVGVSYDTVHDVTYVRHSPELATSRSVATSIIEAGGTDHGFLWRLQSYWRYAQVGPSVRIDVLSLSLSRSVPWALRRFAEPLIWRVGRESMAQTLTAIQSVAETQVADAWSRPDPRSK